MNEMQLLARADIQKLRDFISIHYRPAHFPRSAMAGKPTREGMAELRQQVQQAKDENTRKTKIIAALKAAKAAEDQALEKSQSETRNLDEQCKRYAYIQMTTLPAYTKIACNSPYMCNMCHTIRLQRALSAKDGLTKDLKTRVDSLEEALGRAEKLNQMQGTEEVTDSALTVPKDIQLVSLSVPELRSKVKELELDRSRGRTRLQARKEKIVELESDCKNLREENDRLRKSNEKLEGLKSTLARRENTIEALRQQVDKLRVELEAEKTKEASQHVEAEKKIK